MDAAEADCPHPAEDFRGTFAAACEWIRRRDDNTAVGVDLDGEVLDWGRERNPHPGGRSASRLEILQKDVRDSGATASRPSANQLLFKTRADLRTYFESVHRDLAEDGIPIRDVRRQRIPHRDGGERHLDGFTYVWDQSHYNPVNNDVNHIHFRFPDGSEMSEAFTYEWRLWSLSEIRELLTERVPERHRLVGGHRGGLGEGDGEFEPTEEGEAPGLDAYLTAEK